MSRHVVLGNGSLTAGIDKFGLIHDFYYPYVGLENLTNARNSHHKIGVWVDGTFSWVDDGSWRIEVNFRDDALIAHVMLHNDELGIKIHTEDFVDPELDVLCRKITILNTKDTERECRLFMHQIFQISRSGRADTALYVPDNHYIFDYKGRTCLIAAGVDQDGAGFDQYAVGNYGIEGKEGTFKDAEDGELSGSAVEHGGVDSVIRFSKRIAGHASHSFDYWVAAGESQSDAEAIHTQIKSEGISARKEVTLRYWKEWLGPANKKLQDLAPNYQTAAKKSLMTIKAHIDHEGGVIASCDSDIYNYGRDYYSYVWPRDGAYALWPLIRLGYVDEAKQFFRFCQNILTNDGYLMHKYQPDKAVGSTWHPLVQNHHRELAIQEDETAIVIYMLGEYLEHSHDLEFVSSLYDSLIKPAADFMASFIDEETGLPHASYDLWEEKFLTTTYTTAVVIQALLTAADIAQKFNKSEDASAWSDAAHIIQGGIQSLFSPERQHYRKGLLLHPDKSLGFDDTLDVSSLYGIFMFTPIKEEVDRITATLDAVESKLLDKSPSGGLPRYEHDAYFASDPPFMGNPWFVTTLWIAQLYLRLNSYDKAIKYIDWTLDHTLPSGILSEQINPNDGNIKSVTPLVWSHAELVNVLLDVALGQKQ